MVKLLHAADFHLDSPYRSLNAQQARQRRQEGRSNLLRLTQFANAGDVDIVLLAGDLFDSGELYRETMEMLAKALGEIKGRVFIAPGNHDFWNPNGAYGKVQWPDNVHIFRRNAIEAVELPELNCVVYGAAFTQNECNENLLKDFHAPEDGRIHIMVLHGDVDGGTRYNSFSHDEIAQSGLDYLALGHVHTFSGIQKAGNTAWAYPGCPEGRGFDECGEHGVIMGTVAKNDVDLHFVGFGQRRYEIITVDVTGRDVMEALSEALDKKHTETDIYRILFSGETDVGGIDLSKIRDALESRFYQLELRDETRVAEDIWLRAKEDSLCGLFSRNLLRRKAEATTPEDFARIERAARFGLAALENRDL